MIVQLFFRILHSYIEKWRLEDGMSWPVITSSLVHPPQAGKSQKSALNKE